MVHNGSMFTHYGRLDGLYMIDFSKAEYNAVCHMRDRLSRMCAVRNAYGCVQCPLNEREGAVCPCLLLDIKIMEYDLRHENGGE